MSDHPEPDVVPLTPVGALKLLREMRIERDRAREARDWALAERASALATCDDLRKEIGRQATRSLLDSLPPGSVVSGPPPARGGLVDPVQVVAGPDGRESFGTRTVPVRVPKDSHGFRWLRVGPAVFPLSVAGQMQVFSGPKVGSAAEVLARDQHSMPLGDRVPVHEVEEHAELAEALRAAERYVASTGPKAGGGGA